MGFGSPIFPFSIKDAGEFILESFPNELRENLIVYDFFSESLTKSCFFCTKMLIKVL